MRQLALIGLLILFAVSGVTEEYWYVEDMLHDADYEMWYDMSTAEREALILGFVLGHEGLRSEFANDPELYNELGKFAVDHDEYMEWIKSHVNEIYMYPQMRNRPLGVVLQLRHKLVKQLREQHGY